VNFIGAIRGILAVFRRAKGPEWLQPPRGLRLDFATSGWFDVATSASHELLDRIWAAKAEPGDKAVPLRAWLDGGELQAGDRVLLYAGNDELGQLDPDGVAALKRLGIRRSRPIILSATLFQDDDGYRLSVLIPPTKRFDPPKKYTIRLQRHTREQR